MGKIFASFFNVCSGVTVVEYAFNATFVSMAILTGATAVGTRLNAKFTLVSNGLI
jgi:pilus assembly protein Flp/PilA